MSDYKELYLQMMRASEKAIRILVEAQQDCEDQILQEADREQEESRD
jgi:hypothetical protein